ncbi:ParA family protein [Mycobacterium riyadhense]|nr:ParA family protein [Mycobacterium riyadhense]
MLATVVASPYHTIAFANGKGGVGKTSLAANEAALFGGAGYRVLLVELDMQGNCARDFGLPVGEWETVEDLIAGNGEAHAAALMLPGAPSARPPFYENVRPGVDLIAGGYALERIYKYFASNAATQSLDAALIAEIASLNRSYDLILIDAPPVDMTAMDAVLRVAGTVIIPIRADDASIDGLSVVARRFELARQDNPHLMLGGVVRFGLGSSSTRIAQKVQQTVNDILGGTAPVFNNIIRHSDAATFDGRRHGLMAYELESASKIAQRRRLEALRAGAEPEATAVSTGAASSAGLAEDYEGLGMEILQRVNELSTQYAEA